MGFPITVPDDFIGKYSLSKNSVKEEFMEEMIDLHEETFLCELLGAELSGLLIADLDANNMPQAQRFKDIWDPFCQDDNSGIHYVRIVHNNYPGEFDYFQNINTVRRSLGIRKYLLGKLYYEIVTEGQFAKTTTGVKKQGSEVSSDIGIQQTYRNGEARWNLSVDTGDTIQWLICDNLEDYPEYNGQVEESKMYGFL